MESKYKVTDFKPTKIHDAITFLIGPIVRLCVRRNVDPNVFTWLSVMFAFLSGVFISIGYWLSAIVSLLLNGLCDVLDGAIARNTVERSQRLRQMGAFLDPAVDRVNDGFLFIGLLAFGLSNVIEYSGSNYATGILLVSFTLQWNIVFYKLFFSLLMAAAIAHPISSYYRARIESLNIRWKQDKPLTRAGFHIALSLVLIGMWLLPNEYAWRYFIYSVSGLVCIPTIVNLIYRFRHALRLFDEVE